jgi:hypothetical protein
MRTALDLRLADDANHARYRKRFNVSALARQVEALMKEHCNLVSSGVLIPAFYGAKRSDVSRRVGATFIGDPMACPSLIGFSSYLTDRLNPAVEKLYRMYGAGRKGLPLAMDLRVVAIDKDVQEQCEGGIMVCLHFRIPAMERPSRQAAA